MLSFDTNILVYADDPSAGWRHTRAINLLTSTAAFEAMISEQCIHEFLHVCRHKRSQPIDQPVNMVRAWLRVFKLILPPSTIVEDTLALLNTHHLSVWDARLLATCAAGRCTVLLSEDLSDRGQYGPVTVLNPFKYENAQIIAELFGGQE